MRPALRIFNGDDFSSSMIAGPSMMTVRFGDLLAPLADALTSNRAFLEDFSEDEIQVTADLYDVLMACRRLRASA